MYFSGKVLPGSIPITAKGKKEERKMKEKQTKETQRHFTEKKQECSKNMK